MACLLQSSVRGDGKRIIEETSSVELQPILGDGGFLQAFEINTTFNRIGQVAINTLRVLFSDRLLLRNRREGASHQRWLHVRHGLRSFHLHIIALSLACLFLLLPTLLLIARLPENAIPIVHQTDRFLHLPTLLQETLSVLR